MIWEARCARCDVVRSQAPRRTHPPSLAVLLLNAINGLCLCSCEVATVYRWSDDAWAAANATLGINPWAFDHILVDLPELRNCPFWALGTLGGYWHLQGARCLPEAGKNRDAKWDMDPMRWRVPCWGPGAFCEAAEGHRCHFGSAVEKEGGTCAPAVMLQGLLLRQAGAAPSVGPGRPANSLAAVPAAQAGRTSTPQAC